MRPEMNLSREEAKPEGSTEGEGAASLLAGEPAFYLAKPPPDLARTIDMSWSTVSAGNERAFYEILPDGYVDLILRWLGSTCQAFLHMLRDLRELTGCLPARSVNAISGDVRNSPCAW